MPSELAIQLYIEQHRAPIGDAPWWCGCPICATALEPVDERELGEAGA